MPQALLYAIVGAGCAFVVWFLTIDVVYATWRPDPGGALQLDEGAVWQLKLRTVLLYYASLGGLLGLALAAIEPIQDTGIGALRRDARWLLRGAAMGVAGAFAGGVAGEYLMSFLSSLLPGSGSSAILAALPRAAGAAVLGLFLGTTFGLLDMWRSGSMDRLVSSLTGGVVGGLGAAVAFTYLAQRPSDMSALSLITLAACVLGAIGSVSVLRTEAFLLGQHGNPTKYRLGTYHQLVADAPNRIGSGGRSEGSLPTHFGIAHDRDVRPEHAVIRRDPRSRQWWLERADVNATELYLNDVRVAEQPVPLRHGDIITFGKIRFQFSHDALGRRTTRSASPRAIAALTTLVLVLAIAAQPSSAQAPDFPPPYILLESKYPQATELAPGGNTMLARVHFSTYAEPDPRRDSPRYTGYLGEAYKQIYYNGRPVEPLGAPRQVAGADTADVALLLIVDVSTSMHHGNRADDVHAALRSFLEGHRNRRLHVQLLPFGNGVPEPVWGWGSAPVWATEFVPLTAENVGTLTAAVDEIRDHTLRSVGVKTCLHGAFLEGCDRLTHGLPAELAARFARPVLIMLTDGANETGDLSDARYRDVTLEEVAERLSESSIAVYTIGFALGAAHLPEMHQLATAVESMTFMPVPSGDAAAAELAGAYDRIMQAVGSSWYLDFDTGMTPEKIATDGIPAVYVHGASGEQPPAPIVMVLLPSVQITWDSRPISTALWIIGALALAAGLRALLLWRLPAGATTQAPPDEPPAPRVVRRPGRSLRDWRENRGEILKGDDATRAE